MTRQLENIAVYPVSTDNGNYIVTLDRLNNDYSGNPRFKAHIVDIDHLQKYGYCGGWTYTFTGHHCGEAGEAEHIVKYHERKADALRTA